MTGLAKLPGTEGGGVSTIEFSAYFAQRVGAGAFAVAYLITNFGIKIYGDQYTPGITFNMNT